MAVKKKSAAKKAAVKKSAVKKTVAKKSTAKKAVAKKSVAKKSAVKKTVKKSAVKKSAVKKSAAKKSTAATSVVIPPVPSSATLGAARVDVTSTPKPVTKSVAAPAAPAKPAKPSAAPKQGASGKVLAAIIVGIILLAVVVVTRPDSDVDDAAPAPAASASAMPSEEPSAQPTPEATSAPVAAVEAPKAIGNWKDAAQTTMVISWTKFTATEGLTGFRVESSSNGTKNWQSFAEVSSSEYSIEMSKTSEEGSTSIRVVALYSDGQEVIGNEFGFGFTLA